MKITHAEIMKTVALLNATDVNQDDVLNMFDEEDTLPHCCGVQVIHAASLANMSREKLVGLIATRVFATRCGMVMCTTASQPAVDKTLMDMGYSPMAMGKTASMRGDYPIKLWVLYTNDTFKKPKAPAKKKKPTVKKEKVTKVVKKV